MIAAFDIGGSKMLSGLYEDSGKQVSCNETKTPIDDYDAFLEAIKKTLRPRQTPSAFPLLACWRVPPSSIT